MANRYKDPDELNNRYKPEDDDEEYIPEEELTEEEREMARTIGSITAEGWQTILGWVMDEEDRTLSREEYSAKNILAKLNSTNIDEKYAYKIKLAIANMVAPDQAVNVIKRLKKKPEEGANIPPEILEIIYAKAKEYRG